jgi:hypothetical protein
MKRKSRIPVARPNVTREAVELFRFVEDCIETGDDKFWEPEGGRKQQYLDGDRALMKMFGLHLGDISPCAHSWNESVQYRSLQERSPAGFHESARGGVAAVQDQRTR